MQKIGMLQAFVELKETEDATFVHPQGNEDQARLIKMRILAELPVNLYIVPVEYDHDEKQVTAHHDEPEFLHFLAHVEPGLEQLEFYWKGSFCLRLKGGSIWLDTYDNTAFNVESVEPVSFARLWEREERDPRILEIERQARHNQMLLQEQMAADRAAFAAQMGELLQQARTNVAPAPVAPSTPAGGATPESASVPSAGDQQSAAAAAGGTVGQS